MEQYIIYAHINKNNGKTYIGQTKQSLARRFRHNGEGYQKCSRFFDAIQKEGWDSFKHVILFENLTLEQANLIEEYLINKFDLRNEEKGYNINKGGHGFSQFISENISQSNKINWEKGIYDNIKNQVYCVELNRNFESVLEAERQTGIDNSSIQKVCKNKLKYAGFMPNGQPIHWIYSNQATPEKINELKNKHEILKGIKIPVYCFELNELFNSTTDVKQKYGFSPGSIRGCITGKNKSAGKHPITKVPLHWKECPELINTKNKLTKEKIEELKQ